MEKEELIEMINSTINTNGSGTITGESLNLALNAIVETMGAGGGAVWEKVSGTPDFGSELTVVTTDEDKAANIELINRCKQCMINGQPVMCYLPVVINNESGEFGAGMCISGTPTIIDGQFLFTGIAVDLFTVLIAEDGSVTMQVGS